MNEPSHIMSLEETVVIVGVGMIGGSLAAAIKRARIVNCVIGVGRDPARLEAARISGLIDEAATDISKVIRRATLVIFCIPVERVVEDVLRTVTSRTATTGNLLTESCDKNVLYTDVGSVKGPICSALEDVPEFVGSHPIAGSHRQGFESADAGLFQNRLCVVTPVASASESKIRRLENFWRAVGMRTARMSPEAHDSALAMTSHLPHVAAAALASTLSAEYRPLTGSGFRDTTRVAGGDPELWTGILTSNAAPVIHGIDRLQTVLSAYREALANGDSAAIRRLLAEGQRSRSSVDET